MRLSHTHCLLKKEEERKAPGLFPFQFCLELDNVTVHVSADAPNWSLSFFEDRTRVTREVGRKELEK